MLLLLSVRKLEAEDDDFNPARVEPPTAGGLYVPDEEPISVSSVVDLDLDGAGRQFKNRRIQNK